MYFGLKMVLVFIKRYGIGIYMANQSTYFLVGVDGGGTGCRVAIASMAGERLGEAIGGPANYTTDPDLAIRSVRAAIEVAADNAGLESIWVEQSTAHLGLAGIMSPEDASIVKSAMPFSRTAVSDDRATSVAGALGDRDGMLAALGTGTIVAGQKNGSTRFFGGWGHQLADQASGGWLGRRALRRTMLAFDGLTTPSSLTHALLAQFNDSPTEMIAFANKAGPGDFASLARIVIEAAQGGDDTGQSLMRDGANYLCRCIEELNLGEDAVLCLAGGVGPHYAPYLPKAYRDRIRPAYGTAVDGALALARQALEKREGIE